MSSRIQSALSPSAPGTSAGRARGQPGCNSLMASGCSAGWMRGLGASQPLPQPLLRFPSSGFLWADPSPSQLSLPALPSSQLRPGVDRIHSGQRLVLGWGGLSLMGQPSSSLAASPSSLPPSSSQGLVWPSPCTAPFPGGKFPRSRSWKRRTSWGLGKSSLLCLRILETRMLHGVTHLGKAQEPYAQLGMEMINLGALLVNPLCWFFCLLKN